MCEEGDYLLSGHVEEFADDVHVPCPYVFGVGVEEDSGGVAAVYPDVVKPSCLVPSVLYALRHDASAHEQFEAFGVEFDGVVDVVDVLHGDAHHLSDLGFALVAHATHGLVGIGAELPFDVL